MYQDYLDEGRPKSVLYSHLDSKRFGQKIGRVSFGPDDSICLRKLSHDVQEFDLVFVRLPTSKSILVRELMKELDVFQADTLTYFCKVGLASTADMARPPTELVTPDCVAAHIRASFVEYVNHYTADPDLDKSKSLEGYVEWATRMSGEANVCLVPVVESGHLNALAVVQIVNQSAEILLNSVEPSARGRGIYSHLLELVEEEIVLRGCTTLRVSTQVSNRTVINTLIRRGFLLEETFMTLHVRPKQ